MFGRKKIEWDPENDKPQQGDRILVQRDSVWEQGTVVVTDVHGDPIVNLDGLLVSGYHWPSRNWVLEKRVTGDVLQEA